jgi:hypothetical protein
VASLVLEIFFTGEGDVTLLAAFAAFSHSGGALLDRQTNWRSSLTSGEAVDDVGARRAALPPLIQFSMGQKPTPKISATATSAGLYHPSLLMGGLSRLEAGF